MSEKEAPGDAIRTVPSIRQLSSSQVRVLKKAFIRASVGVVQ